MTNRRLERMLVSLKDGKDYVAAQVWVEEGWLHLEDAQELTAAGRLHGSPGPYLFPREDVRRVQRHRRWTG